MGLEAGWNCHISLLNDGGASNASDGQTSVPGSSVQGRRSADSSASQDNLGGRSVQHNSLRLLVEEDKVPLLFLSDSIQSIRLII